MVLHKVQSFPLSYLIYSSIVYSSTALDTFPKSQKTVTIASYADDLVIIGYSQSAIQKAINSIASKANKICLKINISKTDFMLIYRKTKPSLVNKNIILKLNDQKLNQVYHK